MKEKVKTKKYTDFTVEHIKKYLDEFRKLVLKGNYSISINKNRRENSDFIETYKIDTKKEREIFLSLQYEDFHLTLAKKVEVGVRKTCKHGSDGPKA